MTLRIGAVGYLNARPMVHGLERSPGRFSVRFDVPSKCASLLHEGDIDLGLIPSIEYLQQPDYYIVPGVAIASLGPVASVAVFASRPMTAVRSIALDSSSRTSAALLRVLCAERFGVAPAFVTMAPEPAAMLRQCDAALLIGDVALFFDHETAGVDKLDLGAEWTAMTGLPFVWAFWAGRPGIIEPDDVQAIQRARDAGVGASDAIADAYCNGNPRQAALGRAYLRENIRYGLGPDEQRGLQRFYESAFTLGIVPASGPVRFYEERRRG